MAKPRSRAHFEMFAPDATNSSLRAMARSRILSSAIETRADMLSVPFCVILMNGASKRKMTQDDFSILGDFVTRLRECRAEMELTQAQFATKAGVGLGAQNRYEQGATEPSASYFANLAAHGVDIQYLITGRPSGDSLDDGLVSILAAARRLSEVQQAALLAFLSTL